MNLSKAAAYIHYQEGGYAIGMAMMEPYGIRIWGCEIDVDPSHPYGAIDSLLHLLFVTGSRELIVGSTHKERYDAISDNFANYEITRNDREIGIEEQNALFATAFGLRSLLSPTEHLNLEDKPLCARAMALLCETLIAQGEIPCAVPVLMERSEWMELGNNALEQLEIVSNDPTLPQVASLFLGMATPMGRRLGRFRLFLPIRDHRELNSRYDWIDAVSSHADWLQERLRRIGDVELYWWHIRNGRGSEEIVGELNAALLQLIEIEEYLGNHRLKNIRFNNSDLADWPVSLRNHHQERQWVENQFGFVSEMIAWVARLDVAVTSSLSARRFGLARPKIVENASSPFVQMMQVRHLLVEMRTNTYVPNDIVMGERDYLDLPYPNTVMLDSKVHDGENIRGVMLYGINSSGKSSLMKSIGIAVILAQAGFYVPAKSMKFALFDAVFTRIQSRDNIAKSLSTFGVEMLELNTIFSRATERSLVLGDEISHGTETLSAVAIVAATIGELVRKRGLFLMTTHLHQLSMIPELSRYRQVVSLHLSVRYDENSDRLVYDRILRPGRGSSVYGLEFAESLHMNPTFLAYAKQLREKLAKEYDVLELGNQKEYIKRYREVVACECVVCGALIRNTNQKNRAGEHHHLIPLCEIHTRQIAEGKIKVSGLIMTPQGLRFEYETQLI